MRKPWLWMLVLGLGLAVPIVALADEAEEAYERAREALEDEEFRAAVERFRDLRDDFPQSDLMPNVVYWEAFARYRMGSSRNLRRAAELLEMHRDRYRAHSTHEEAERLYTRIMGQLAERGEIDAAEEVHKRADDLDTEEVITEERLADVFRIDAEVDVTPRGPRIEPLRARHDDAERERPTERLVRSDGEGD